MGLFDTIKSWFSPASTDQREPEGDTFDPERFVYLKIPGNIQPMDRGEWFEDRISPVLAEAGLGEVSGGGSSLSDADGEGRRTIEYCGIDIDTTDREPALALLRELLPQLPITTGTELQYTCDGRMLRDVYADGAWSIALAREERHPGFGV